MRTGRSSGEPHEEVSPDMESFIELIAAVWQAVDIPGFDLVDLLNCRQATFLAIWFVLVVVNAYASGYGRVIFLTDPIVNRVERFFVLLCEQRSTPSRHVPFHQSSALTQHRSIQPLCLCCRINS